MGSVAKSALFVPCAPARINILDVARQLYVRHPACFHEPRELVRQRLPVVNDFAANDQLLQLFCKSGEFLGHDGWRFGLVSRAAFAAAGGDQTSGCSLAALVTAGMSAFNLATVALNFWTELLISVLGATGFARFFNSSRVICFIG